ncbi:MAG: hypothetical protein A49_08450 [Methyloceanibacter sp.]|nr:MAG: hypothetical protein A49_08450 [Methyloceanibacter sp.]
MAETKIAGGEYRVQPLGAKDAYKLLGELIRLAGPGARHLPAILTVTTDSSEGKMLADTAELIAVSDMLSVHGVDAFAEFKAGVCAVAQVKRPSGSYDEVDLDADFVGDLEGAEKLFNFVMEHAFGNFFKGNGAVGPAALALVLIRNVFQSQKFSKSRQA